MKTIFKLSLAFIILLVCAIGLLVFDVFSSQNRNKGDNPILILVNRVKYLSRWDAQQEYRITPFLVERRFKNEAKDVTLVTQCSYHNLHLLLKLIDFWQGPISIAVFSETEDVLNVIKMVASLRQCDHNFAVFVSLHLVVFEGNGNLNYNGEKAINCTAVLDLKYHKAKNYKLKSPYPVNLMRNVARMNLTTDYFLLIDVDMAPNLGLRHNFLHLLRTSPPVISSVYIVPAFELKEKVALPETKADIKELVSRNAIRPFYAELCVKCHSCVDYKVWLNLPSSSGLSVAYITYWQDPCEPFYIAHKDVPLYDESFVQYGFNRISQVCELYVAGYDFAVLDNAFLSHFGWKTEDSFHETKRIEQELNRKRFQTFKQNLKFKYPTSPRSC